MKNFVLQHNDNVQVNVEQTADNGVYKITVDYSAVDSISPVMLMWKEQMTDIYSVWTPLGDRNRSIKQWIAPTKSISSFCKGAPILCTVSGSGSNRATVGLSEFVKPTEISFSVDDIHQKDEVTYSVTLFNTNTEYDTCFTVYLRIDESNVPYHAAIQNMAKWFENFVYDRMHVCESATLPLYSTWYNFHQFPDQNEISKELAVAKDIGFKTVILDDGWQYDGESTGDYRNCGNWAVAKTKFPDFDEFVSTVHNLGMKLLVWFPVPFVGFDTQDYQTYKDKILYDSEEFCAGILDVRYKEIRDYIVNNYIDFVKRYNVDGLKLDFIDSFLAPTDNPYRDGMDKQTVEQGVIALLDQIKQQLTQTKPNFMIEFRQNYIGAKIVSYANMLRVLDCAYDSITNRIGIVDLRLISPYTAVHADMLYWSKNEPIENCAKQLYNILFGVPQISVKLTNNTTEQLKLIKHFVEYYTANKEVLLNGSLELHNPEVNYSQITAELNNKSITVLYSQNDYVCKDSQQDVFNCTDKDYVIVDANNATASIDVFDRYGEKQQACMVKGIAKLPVEIGGYCKIK